MTDRDALIARLRAIAAANVCDLYNMGDEAHEPPEITWGELNDIGLAAKEAADALAALPPPATLSSFQEEARQKLRDVLARYDLLDEVHGLGRDVDEAVRWALGALADPTATDAATPPPADPLPPRPTGSEPINRADLVRYGVATPGSPTLLTPMADGYWTPWHIAAQVPADPPALVALVREWRQAVTAPLVPPLEMDDNAARTRYRRARSDRADAAHKALLAYPLPAAPPVTDTPQGEDSGDDRLCEGCDKAIDGPGVYTLDDVLLCQTCADELSAAAPAAPPQEDQ